MKRYLLPGLGVLLLCLPPALLNNYWLDVFNMIGLSAMLALSLNVIVGYAGMFHMGHTAFYAVGAYTTAILNTQYGVPIMWTMPISGLVAGLFALVVARPIIHLRGDYLLLVTIGLVEIVRIALQQDIFGITGGANGIAGIDRPVIFGFRIYQPMHFYLLIWAGVGITMLLFTYLEHSRFGRALKFIRDDDVAAEGSGVNVASYKLAAFVFGAFWAGMVGTLLAAKMSFVSPESFTFWESVILFVIVILGGSGNLSGVLLGAFLVVGLPELFRDLKDTRMLFYGLAMILLMIFRPKGLLPPKSRQYKISGLLGPLPDPPGAGEQK